MVFKYLLCMQQIIYIGNKPIINLNDLKDSFLKFRQTNRFINLFVNPFVLVDIVIGEIIRVKEHPEKNLFCMQSANY